MTALTVNTKNRLQKALTSQGAANDLINNVQKLHYVNTAASTAISATSSETAFDTSYTIPANTLRAGSVIKVRFQGIATATNSTDTLTIKLYIGGLTGTAIFTSTATDATNNDIFTGEGIIVIRTIGSSGTFVASGSYTKVEGASGSATRVDFVTASTAIDTTTSKAVTASATWSTNSASNSCRMDIFAVEVY